MNYFIKSAASEVSTNRYNLIYTGIIIYKSHEHGKQSVSQFARDWKAGMADFNELRGTFRLIMKDKQSDVLYFFGDNSENTCFYYTHNLFSDSFLSLCEANKKIDIDYDSTAQFLQFGCIFGQDTLAEGIKRTDSNCYYVFANGKISEKNKNLTPFENMHQYKKINDVISKIISLTKELKVGCTLTGGVDSRMVLANILACGVKPELYIAEEPEHIDAKIATEISEKLKINLNIISSKYAGDDYLEDAFFAGDATTGLCARYTLPLMRKEVALGGINALYGGFCGELYKNSFLNQDFPFYSRASSVNIDKFYRMKVASSDYPQYLCGEKIKRSIERIPYNIKEHLNTFVSQDKVKSYFDMGFWMMKQRGVSISNAANFITTTISPLLERDCLSVPYHMPPYGLELQGFARNDITAYAPEIASVKTDRGLTCLSSVPHKCLDIFANYAFLLKFALSRISARKKVFSGSNSNYLLARAVASDKFNDALRLCASNKIIPDKIMLDNIPLIMADRIFTLGFLLLRYK